MKGISLNRLNRLNRRERYYVVGGAILIAIFLVLQLVIFPVLDKRDRLKRALSEKSKTLSEIQVLQSEYHDLEKKARVAKARLSRRDKDFTLFSYLGTLADEVGIKENVTSMKPSSSVIADVNMATVELKIDTITMAQFTKYLYEIEYSDNNLFVKRMVISKTSKAEGYIDVSMQVETVAS